MADPESGQAGSSYVKALTQVNNHLAVTLYRLLGEEKGNVFFSPYSVSTVMGMLLCAARGETEAEMRSALIYDQAEISPEDVGVLFDKQMTLLLKNPASYTLSCANLMLSQKGLDIKSEFKTLLEESFKALLSEVDFVAASQKAIDQINGWVNQKTKGTIPQMVDSLDTTTVMILLNAVYFKGTWFHKFYRGFTCAREFFNGGSEKNAAEVQMMRQKEDFLYAETKSFQALQLAYFGNDVAMLILLPRKIDGVLELEASLAPTFVVDIKNTLREETVDVRLPKFRLEYSKSLMSHFRSLGINRVFCKGAELGGASDSPNLLVSEILHKAVLEVNEEGSEAAAFARLDVDQVCDRCDPEFIADHPFLFVIYDTRSNLILFMGRTDNL